MFRIRERNLKILRGTVRVIAILMCLGLAFSVGENIYHSTREEMAGVQHPSIDDVAYRGATDATNVARLVLMLINLVVTALIILGQWAFNKWAGSVIVTPDPPKARVGDVPGWD